MVFLVLTWVHVWANMRALRCLVLVSLNEPRLQLLLQHYLTKVSMSTLFNMRLWGIHGACHSGLSQGSTEGTKCAGTGGVLCKLSTHPNESSWLVESLQPATDF